MVPFAAALKLDANKIAKTDSRTTEMVIWSAEARAEVFWCFFIFFLGLAQVREVLRGVLLVELRQSRVEPGISRWMKLRVFS